MDDKKPKQSKELKNALDHLLKDSSQDSKKEVKDQLTVSANGTPQERKAHQSRPKEQREREQEQIWELSAQGKSIRYMAKKFNLGLATVHRELRIITQRKGQELTTNAQEHRAVKIKEFAFIRNELLKAWIRSTKGRKVVRDGPKGTTVTIFETPGDTQYLEQFIRVLEIECKLLGIEQMPQGWKPTTIEDVKILNTVLNDGKINELHDQLLKATNDSLIKSSGISLDSGPGEMASGGSLEDNKSEIA